MVTGWARLGWSGGGGSAVGWGDGGNLNNDKGGLVSLTAGRSFDASCDTSEEEQKEGIGDPKYEQTRNTKGAGDSYGS